MRETVAVLIFFLIAFTMFTRSACRYPAELFGQRLDHELHCLFHGN